MPPQRFFGDPKKRKLFGLLTANWTCDWLWIPLPVAPISHPVMFISSDAVRSPWLIGGLQQWSPLLYRHVMSTLVGRDTIFVTWWSCYLNAGLVCTASCPCACAHRNHNKIIGIIVFCLIFETSVYVYPTGHWAPRLEKQYVSECGIGLRVMSFCHLMRR